MTPSPRQHFPQAIRDSLFPLSQCDHSRQRRRFTIQESTRKGRIKVSSQHVLRYQRSHMNILSWNICALRGLSEQRINDISTRIVSRKPDIVLLQEVSSKPGFISRIRDRFKASNYDDFFFSGKDCINEKSYGNVIAVKRPHRILDSGCLKGAPWPQLLARACVEIYGMRTEIISVHMPNGSQNGWKKIQTFKALSAFLQKHGDRPCIFGGDFNEPRKFLPGGDIISFGHRKASSGGFTLQGDRKGSPSGRMAWRGGGYSNSWNFTPTLECLR